MMSTSDQTYKELAIPYFKEVFDIIDDVLLKHQVPYYLIGANAISLQLLKKGYRPSRGTKDIDFALMIASMEVYELVTADMEKAGFKKVAAPWTFYHSGYNAVVDLLPFGELEEQFTQDFNQRTVDLHVLGLKEVLEASEGVSIEERTVNIPPLHGMIILKLIAWNDRPEGRDSDPGDILKIIETYYEYEEEAIVEEHSDTFENDPFDRLKIAARVLGRNAQHYLSASELLKDRILDILETNLEKPEDSVFIKKWAREKQWDLSYATEVFEEFKIGITEQ